MSHANLSSHLVAVAEESGKYGLCVMVPWKAGAAQVRETALVPNRQVCLSTVLLLAEGGFHELEWTQDRGNPYHFMLWLPDAPSVDSLISSIRSVFRGPLPKEALHDGWTTADIRGLQQPGS